MGLQTQQLISKFYKNKVKSLQMQYLLCTQDQKPIDAIFEVKPNLQACAKSAALHNTRMYYNVILLDLFLHGSMYMYSLLKALILIFCGMSRNSRSPFVSMTVFC